MDARETPVVIEPGRFNRKIPVRENVLMAIISPYLAMARAMCRASWRKYHIDWGGMWNVPDSRGGFSVTGPAVGASIAAMMIDTLIARGAKRIVAVGCCGSIREDVGIGDLVIATGAISEEGVSAHYAPDRFQPEADREMVEKLKSKARERSWQVKTGTLWTTDAPYRETCEKVKAYGERGILGVEMELSAIFTVAKFRGVQAGAVLAVSDELATLKWNPGFFNPKFLSASRRAVRLAIDAIRNR